MTIVDFKPTVNKRRIVVRLMGLCVSGRRSRGLTGGVKTRRSVRNLLPRLVGANEMDG